MAETNITEITPGTVALEKQENIDNQVDIKTYLARLPEVDRQNLKEIITSFETVMAEKGRKGTLKAVGGTINKQLPRKDIDLTLRLDDEDNDPKREDFPDYFQYSVANYDILRNIVGEIVAKNKNLKIVEETRPTIDEEYQSPSILKNDGAIKIKPKEGTLIEVIRRPSATSAIETEPYVILSEI